uniref:Ovule protein n=1 Tax=Mesocestoides corti TaxID=53468 RepID=A0A5K3FYL8_MESCO
WKVGSERELDQSYSLAPARLPPPPPPTLLPPLPLSPQPPHTHFLCGCQMRSNRMSSFPTINSHEITPVFF